MKKEKSLIDLLIELDQVEKRLDKIKNDPDYISQKAKEVFGNVKKDHTEALNRIIELYA